MSTDNNMIILNDTFSYKIRKCILLLTATYWPDIWAQASHQLNLALLRSRILHITVCILKWKWNKTASNSC